MKKYLAVRLIDRKRLTGGMFFGPIRLKKERGPYNKQVSLAVKPPNWYGHQKVVNLLLPWNNCATVLL